LIALFSAVLQKGAPGSETYDKHTYCLITYRYHTAAAYF